MCIRDSRGYRVIVAGLDQDYKGEPFGSMPQLMAIAEYITCLLYTSDAADDLLCVDLGGRRIIKKKKATHFRATISEQATLNQV